MRRSKIHRIINPKVHQETQPVVRCELPGKKGRSVKSRYPLPLQQS